MKVTGADGRVTLYEYDGEDIRTAVTAGGIRTEYTTDRESAYSQTLIKTEYEKNVFGFYTEQRSRTVYTYGLGLAGERRDGGEEYYYHYNHIGSTMAVSDGGGNVIYRFAYDAYGELSDITTDDGVSLKTTERPDTPETMKEADAAGIPETAPQYTLAQLAHATGIDYLYNGQYGVMTDQNGLYYMRARYYDQDIKRFINRDVVSGSISNSQSLNRYSYVQGNPVSLTDPFGLCPDPNSNFKNFCVVLYNADWNAIGHGTLDVLGLFWDGFDVANVFWYASEGKTEEAIACAVSALPGVGMIAGGLLAKTSKFKNAGKAVKYASRMTQGAIGTVAGAQITYTGLTNIINGIESGTLSAGDVATFLGGIAITTLSGKNMVSSGRALQGVFDDVGKVSKAGKGQIAGSENSKNTRLSLQQALKELDASGLRPGQTELHTSQLNKVLDEIQNNYNPTKAYSSVYSDGTNRYLVEGHHTTVAFKMLGKENAINMNTATKDLPSSTNVYWTKKWYQFWRRRIKIVED